MDLLSSILDSLQLRGLACGGVDAGADVSLTFPAHPGVKCYALLSGDGWLQVEGAGGAIMVQAGDCVVLPSGRPFRLATDLTAQPVDYATALKDGTDGAFVTIGGGGSCTIVGGYIAFDADHAERLLRDLPAIIHIRSATGRAAMRGSLTHMMEELQAERPGRRMMVEYLARMMLIQALRVFISEADDQATGWLRASGDPHIGKALAAIHSTPAKNWTVAGLAQLAGLSRTVFATRFRAMLGQSPIAYLARWRITLAEQKLVRSGEPISAIAFRLGYGSESAFSTAFKRLKGYPPREHVKRAE